ncbi:pyridoxal phosphate-dependent decarboxylase family protein [Mycobacterium bourgelatii]|nr:pyridoxal-dependent decarboxylase [Mycobacterium bourgelatii]MCV6976499.1 hypothetical protein [Mycobacterium bourgelatii]
MSARVISCTVPYRRTRIRCETGKLVPVHEWDETASGFDLARRSRCIWVHVDAAAGGCLMLSDAHRDLLDGISTADSITIDFHKLLFQAISCGALLLRDRNDFEVMRKHADFLNPEDDDPEDTLNHVERSLQTTRRFDALKVLVTLRSLGLDTVAAMIGRTVDTARAAERAVAADPHLELISPCMTNTVVLRWTGSDVSPSEREVVNVEIRRRLADTGQAIVGRTRVDGEAALKLTFVNPVCTPDLARDLVRRIADCGNNIRLESREILEASASGAASC